MRSPKPTRGLSRIAPPPNSPRTASAAAATWRRCDFPGGDARVLWHSIRKLLALPPETRIFNCHDYKAPGRAEFAWESTVAEQRARNPHVRDGIVEEEFVAMREGKDAKLVPPLLLLPSIQVNMRAGRFPPAEANGVRYMRIPVVLGGGLEQNPINLVHTGRR